MRWLLGGELHPGGAALTRRAFDLLDLDADDRLLDVGSGDGSTVLLAAEERGCRAVGLEYGPGAVESAAGHAAELGLLDRVEFATGDAGSLPFEDACFDAVISECSLCLFADKRRAVGEIARVLTPRGRVAIADVVADAERLPPELRGAIATIACVGEALPPGAHRELLEGAGFELDAEEDHAPEAAEMADRVIDRVRGAKVAGLELPGLEGGMPAALALLADAREALADGRIGYTLISGTRS